MQLLTSEFKCSIIEHKGIGGKMVKSLKKYIFASVVAIVLMVVFIILAIQNFSVVYNIVFIVATVISFVLYLALILMQMIKYGIDIDRILSATIIDNTELYNSYELVKNNSTGVIKQIKMAVYINYCSSLIILNKGDMAYKVLAEFENRFYSDKNKFAFEKELIVYSYYLKINLAMLSNDLPTAKQNLAKIHELINTISNAKTLSKMEFYVSLATCKIDLANNVNARKWLDYLIASKPSIIQYNNMVKLMMKGYARALLGEKENAIKAFQVVECSDVSMVLCNKAKFEIEKLNNNGCPCESTKLECDVIAKENKITEDGALKNEGVTNNNLFYSSNSSVFHESGYEKKMKKKAKTQNDGRIIKSNFVKRNRNYLLFLGLQLLALGLGMLVSFGMNSQFEGYETNIILNFGFSIILVGLVSGMVLLYNVYDKVLHMSKGACIGLSIITSFIGYIPGVFLALPMTVTAIIMMFLTKNQIYATPERRERKRNSILKISLIIFIIVAPIVLSILSL